MSNGVILKKKNVLNVIKTIKNYGPITKPEVSKRTKMTPVSIHNFINELMAKNILVECGNAESNGGRKPVIYKLNPSYGFVIGQCLTLTGLRTALFDFSMEKICTDEIFFSNLNVNEIISLMSKQINKMAAEYGHSFQTCLGVGITIPGQINPISGIVKNITNMPLWNDISLKSIIEKEVKGPIFIENDNRAIALAMKWMDEVNEDSCIVYVAIGTGVGAGILYKGELFNGMHYNAGEIGHITVEYNGRLCNCGNRGCLELMISDKSIIARMKEELEKRDKSDDIDSLLSSDWNIDKVIQLGLKGNQIVMSTLREACKYIFICIDNIVKIYDPEEIIFECSWLQAFPELFEEVKDEFFRRCHWVNKRQISIRLNIAEDIFVTGAATLVIEDLFRFVANNILLNKL